MKSLFNKNLRNKDTSSRNITRSSKKQPIAASEKITGLITSTVSKVANRMQQGWAQWMQKKTASLSIQNWKVVVIGFVLLSGGYSLFLLINGFRPTDNHSFQITPIRKPAHAIEDGDMPRMPIDSIAFRDSIDRHLKDLEKHY